MLSGKKFIAVKCRRVLEDSLRVSVDVVDHPLMNLSVIKEIRKPC